MEDHDSLDLSNPIHMFFMQYVFAPLIEQDLQTWEKSHNSHPLRTGKNQTHFQLWYSRSIVNQENDSTAINNLLRLNNDERNTIINEMIRRVTAMGEPSEIHIVLPHYTPPSFLIHIGSMVPSSPLVKHRLHS